MEEKATVPPGPRPYFLPPGIDFESLPEAVRMAFDEIVTPCYLELVVGATSALARSSGSSFVFLLTVEILDQFDIGQGLDFGQMGGPDQAAARHKKIEQHLRVVGAKQKLVNFLVRLPELRARHGKFT